MSNERPDRRSIRLPGFDYASGGAYFVTTCAADRGPLFGRIVGDTVELTLLGRIVERTWREIPSHFPGAALEAFVAMPNHLHGIVFLEGAGRGDDGPPLRPGPKRGSLGALMGSFKAAASRAARREIGAASQPLWQRGYYEHVVRTEDELIRIAEYIEANPMRWSSDRENPNAASAHRTRREPWEV